MTAIGLILICAAVVLAAVLDWAKWKLDRQRFSDEELRRILTTKTEGD